VRQYKRRHFIVAAQDEATFGLIPVVARGWARRGSNPSVLINHKNICTNVFGARSQRSFVYTFAKRKRQREFVKFLALALRRWRRVLLFIDNGPAHKGKQVDDFCRRHQKTLRIERFLTYTPELNPIEQCWKPARMALANRVLRTLPAAQYHLRKNFNNPKAMPKYYQYLRD
jgi:hypothetical protein